CTDAASVASAACTVPRGMYRKSPGDRTKSASGSPGPLSGRTYPCVCNGSGVWVGYSVQCFVPWTWHTNTSCVSWCGVRPRFHVGQGQDPGVVLRRLPVDDQRLLLPVLGEEAVRCGGCDQVGQADGRLPGGSRLLSGMGAHQ